MNEIHFFSKEVEEVLQQSNAALPKTHNVDPVLTEELQVWIRDSGIQSGCYFEEKEDDDVGDDFIGEPISVEPEFFQRARGLGASSGCYLENM